MALILIADPSASERQRLRTIVEQQEHVVVEADNGTYCLEIAEYHHPHCIICNLLLDQGQPDLLPALEALKIPTIVLTDTALPTPTVLSTGPTFATLNKAPTAVDLLQTLTAALTGDEASSVPLSSPVVPAKVLDPMMDQGQPTPAQEKTPSQRQPALLGLDQLQMVIGEGLAQATNMLTEITGSPLILEPPLVDVLMVGSLKKLLQDRFGDTLICATQLPFAGSLSGTAQLFFPESSALSLTTALTGEEAQNPEIEQLKEEALTEVGNIVLNSVMGAMGNALNQTLVFSVPVYLENTIAILAKALLSEENNAKILLAQTQFMIEEFQVKGEILLFFKMQLFFNLIQSD